MPSRNPPVRSAVVLDPGEGRAYDMGRMKALFKADGARTAGAYSISEWWLDPNSKGPGIHDHEEDDVFFVLEGTMSFYLEGRWIEARKGAFVLAPGGMPHDFENRGSSRAGVLNVSIPGGFEKDMPAIVEWFEANPIGDANP